MTDGDIGPCELEGGFVRLEPLREHHAEALVKAGEGLGWDWVMRPIRTIEDAERRIRDGLEAESKGEEYAFAVMHRESGRVIGTTAYLTIVPGHRRAEIGGTWYSPEHWGTVVNPECKYLLLRHAFEDWGAVRMQLTTDVNNARSQSAILKLGAKLEGRMRNHGIRPDGSTRDAFLYSIISSEWPEVKSRLLERLRALGPDGRGQGSG